MQETEVTLAELKLQNNLIKFGLENTFITVRQITAQLSDIKGGSTGATPCTTTTTTEEHVATVESVTDAPFSRNTNSKDTPNSTDTPDSKEPPTSTGPPNSTSSGDADVKVSEGSDIVATAA